MNFPHEKDHIFKLIKMKKNFYEFDLLLFARLLHFRSKCVLDVGSYIGNHTLFFSKVMRKNVIAIEANRSSYELLCENLSVNDVNNVEAHHCAVGANEGYAEIEGIKMENHGECKIKVSSKNSKDPSKVKMNTVDNIVGDRKINLCKIDVEGMEQEVLSGAKRLIERWKPDFLVEIGSDDVVPSIDQFLGEFGYKRFVRFCATPTYFYSAKLSDVKFKCCYRLYQSLYHRLK
jgi:FkbM family methyltransferase